MYPASNQINVVANGNVLATVGYTEGALLAHWCAVAYALDEEARTFGTDAEGNSDHISVMENLNVMEIERIDGARS